MSGVSVASPANFRTRIQQYVVAAAPITLTKIAAVRAEIVAPYEYGLLVY